MGDLKSMWYRFWNYTEIKRERKEIISLSRVLKEADKAWESYKQHPTQGK